MSESSWHRTSLEYSLPGRGVRSSLGGKNSSHPGGGRSRRGDSGRAGCSWLPSVPAGMVGSSWGQSSQPGSGRSHPRGGSRSGQRTCRARSVCHSGQADRIADRRGRGSRVHTRSCRSQGGRCPHSYRCRCCYSWLPRSPEGRAGGSGYPSSQAGTGNVHEQGHSHQRGRSHSDWHSRHQTVPSGRGAGSGPRTTQGCRYRLRFGGCRLLRGRTGSWHCSRSPRFQAGRAQSSSHAANLPCRRRSRRWASRRWRSRRRSARSS